MTPLMHELMEILGRKRFPLEDEKQTQACIYHALCVPPVGGRVFWASVNREVRIAGGIIDVMVDDIGIEVKIKGAGASIIRQVRNYLAEPRINGLLLMTSKPVDVSGVVGKPVAVVDMARAWL